MAAIRGWLNQRGPVAGAGGGFQPANRQATKTLEFSRTQWGSLLYQYIFKERTGGKTAGATNQVVPSTLESSPEM
jgi:hypothetical protein